MSSLFHRPYFKAGEDDLQPLLVSLALSTLAISVFSTIGRVCIGRKRGEGWIGQALNAVATVSPTSDKPILQPGVRMPLLIMMQLLAFVHTIVLVRACTAGLGKHTDGQSLGASETQWQVSQLIATRLLKNAC